ncbi:hypothetical protein FHS39_002497 [Streptomyces olivoverticillatus]|uniref:Uncharacterized protein n=1 Tax=Streptomyces olivoverticillatus TaxID=66427 RepID=A0A7W7PJS6_9ACTN|nr:hypothetical protein [Streptomyces olivoverticillatus]MBB4893466.1 hypothetical protein [Streptomyces olivoverticillatus]
MTHDGMTQCETAVLHGGPADGVTIRVTHRPGVVQVTHPCTVEGPAGGMRIAALYIYRRDLRVTEEPLRYGFDAVSP